MLSGLRIQHWGELWYRLKTRLRSHVVVAQVGRLVAIAPITPQAWEPPYAVGVTLEKTKKKKKKERFLNKKIKLLFS